MSLELSELLFHLTLFAYLFIVNQFVVYLFLIKYYTFLSSFIKIQYNFIFNYLIYLQGASKVFHFQIV